MTIPSKLPDVGTTIFTVMSKLAADHQALNLSQGFPNFNPPAELLRHLTEAVRNGSHQYAPLGGLPALTHAIAAKVERLYGAVVSPETDITITAGATQAIAAAITALVHRGDEVILIEPAYDAYCPMVLLNGGVPVVYELLAPDFRIDWAALAQCVSPRTRLIIVNTPHNPTGVVWEESDWQALEQLVEGTDILVLSDEVYEHLVFDNVGHLSVLARPRLRARAVAVFSFGKIWDCTGWKVGYAVAPAAVMTEFRKIHQFQVFTIHTPSQQALAAYMNAWNNYGEIADFYKRKRDLFAAALRPSRFRLLPSQGTFFQLAAYDAISDEADTDFAKHLTIEHGVAVIPTSVFYTHRRDQKLVRFCFAKTDDLLTKAAEKLCKL